MGSTEGSYVQRVFACVKRNIINFTLCFAVTSHVSSNANTLPLKNQTKEDWRELREVAGLSNETAGREGKPGEAIPSTRPECKGTSTGGCSVRMKIKLRGGV